MVQAFGLKQHPHKCLLSSLDLLTHIPVQMPLSLHISYVLLHLNQ